MSTDAARREVSPNERLDTPLLIAPKIVITGPPAGGKGTQCELLVQAIGVVHLSTGDMLRASIQAGAALGRQAKAFMVAGELVPDALIIDMILERLQQRDCVAHGWLLDGFPRTASQAQAMIRLGILPDTVVVLEVPDDEVIKRISGRRIDPVTGKTYHMEFKPPPPDVRDRVIQRSDDNEATIRNRLTTFHDNCGAILDTFRAATKILTVDGLQNKQLTTNTIIDVIHRVRSAEKLRHLADVLLNLPPLGVRNQRHADDEESTILNPLGKYHSIFNPLLLLDVRPKESQILSRL